MRSLLTGLVTLCLAIPSAGCLTDPPEPPQAETAWRAVHTWSGRGDQLLETFDMPRVTWRVKWAVTNASADAPGTLFVTANSSDSGRVVAEVTEVKGIRGPDHDVSYISDVPHRFYLVVTSSGVDWTLTVEEPLLAQ